MARENTADEAATRREMTDAYKRQKEAADGFDDWGKFTAHVVCEQRREIERLRGILQHKGLDPGDWDDPCC
ncbi:MAG: hypothetical protein J5J06_09150 [Phycisphaerae bacterium]|nr:hypothetical protein [Phycisphaerae bacterium]